MKQHNYWKLRQIQGPYTQIALWVMGLVLLALAFFSSEINFNNVSTVIGLVLPALSSVLMVFEHFLWKTKPVQIVMKRVPFLEQYWTPVLEGRWSGTLNRDGRNHNFVIEIKQSYTSISCVTYSKHSSSEAIFTEILFNEETDRHQLVYYWSAKTKNVQLSMGEFDTFNGFTVLDIISDGEKVSKLSGRYFTERQPRQTHGSLELTFQQKKNVNQYNL